MRHFTESTDVSDKPLLLYIWPRYWVHVKWNARPVNGHWSSTEQILVSLPRVRYAGTSAQANLRPPVCFSLKVTRSLAHHRKQCCRNPGHVIDGSYLLWRRAWYVKARLLFTRSRGTDEASYVWEQALLSDVKLLRNVRLRWGAGTAGASFPPDTSSSTLQNQPPCRSCYQHFSVKRRHRTIKNFWS